MSGIQLWLTWICSAVYGDCFRTFFHIFVRDYNKVTYTPLSYYLICFTFSFFLYIARNWDANFYFSIATVWMLHGRSRTCGKIIEDIEESGGRSFCRRLLLCREKIKFLLSKVVTLFMCLKISKLQKLNMPTPQSSWSLNVKTGIRILRSWYLKELKVSKGLKHWVFCIDRQKWIFHVINSEILFFLTSDGISVLYCLMMFAHQLNLTIRDDILTLNIFCKIALLWLL